MKKKEDVSMRNIRRPLAAVYKVTGIIATSEEATNSRRCDCVFARMLFTRQCSMLGVSNTIISELLRTSMQSVLRYLRKFDDECRYNATFKILADEVEKEMKRYRDIDRRKKDYIDRWEKKNLMI
nr:MAG TPA: hypothetical protein [Caudoviricetes sp.]